MSDPLLARSPNSDYDARFSVFAKMSQASASVMAITKCSIPVPTVNEFTPSLRAARKCARTGNELTAEKDHDPHEQDQPHSRWLAWRRL